MDADPTQQRPCKQLATQRIPLKINWIHKWMFQDSESKSAWKTEWIPIKFCPIQVFHYKSPVGPKTTKDEGSTFEK